MTFSVGGRRRRNACRCGRCPLTRLVSAGVRGRRLPRRRPRRGVRRSGCRRALYSASTVGEVRGSRADGESCDRNPERGRDHKSQQRRAARCAIPPRRAVPVRRPIHLVTGLPAGSSRQTHQTAPLLAGGGAGNGGRTAEDDAPPSGTTRAPSAAEAVRARTAANARCARARALWAPA